MEKQKGKRPLTLPKPGRQGGDNVPQVKFRPSDHVTDTQGPFIEDEETTTEGFVEVVIKKVTWTPSVTEDDAKLERRAWQVTASTALERWESKHSKRPSGDDL